MMKVEIFDVEHGQCSVIHCPNGKKIMIDAGHNTTRNWRPSEHFKLHALEGLVISNFDSDHASDFTNVYNNCSISFIVTNTSVSAAALEVMKKQNGMSDGIKSLHGWMSRAQVGTRYPDYGHDVKVKHFWNNYGSFFDENNLSVVTFIEYGDFCIVFPGDLEVAGWNELLKNVEFRLCLEKVNIFVASHHGRVSGYCEDVFKIQGALPGNRGCRPEIVVISDKSKVHETQETTHLYTKHCTGIDGETILSGRRYVYTTRNDGHLTITIDPPSQNLLMAPQQNWRIRVEPKMDSLATLASLLSKNSLLSPY